MNTSVTAWQFDVGKHNYRRDKISFKNLSKTTNTLDRSFNFYGIETLTQLFHWKMEKEILKQVCMTCVSDIDTHIRYMIKYWAQTINSRHTAYHNLSCFFIFTHEIP